MKLNTYLTFDGQCEAAFRFYEKNLGGKIEFMMNHESSPMADQVPPDWRKKIMHARMSVGDTVLMGSDGPPENHEAIKGCSVSLTVNDVKEAERVFKALGEKAKIGMPMQETFWALRFGTLVDQFGVPWMVNCERPE